MAEEHPLHCAEHFDRVSDSQDKWHFVCVYGYLKQYMAVDFPCDHPILTGLGAEDWCHCLSHPWKLLFTLEITLPFVYKRKTVARLCVIPSQRHNHTTAQVIIWKTNLSIALPSFKHPVTMDPIRQNSSTSPWQTDSWQLHLNVEALFHPSHQPYFSACLWIMFSYFLLPKPSFLSLCYHAHCSLYLGAPGEWTQSGIVKTWWE